MKYQDLTINQKITLKGLLDQEKGLEAFKVAKIFFNFTGACQLLLDNITNSTHFRDKRNC